MDARRQVRSSYLCGIDIGVCAAFHSRNDDPIPASGMLASQALRHPRPAAEPRYQPATGSPQHILHNPLGVRFSVDHRRVAKRVSAGVLASLESRSLINKAGSGFPNSEPDFSWG